MSEEVVLESTKEKEESLKQKDGSEPVKDEKEETTKEPVKEIIEISKSEDKKDIEDEEREKMLNEENKKDGGEVEKKKKALEEAAEKEGTRRRIPIGGIKIPGFLKSKPREKNKDGVEKEEEADLLEPPCSATAVGSDEEKTEKQKNIISKFTFINPFVRKKKPEESPAEGDTGTGPVPIEKRPGFINAIKLPLVSVLPRKLRSSKEPDVEAGGDSTSKPAGLASMETLDDSNGSTKNSDEKAEDAELENVRLDFHTSEEKNTLDADKATEDKPLWSREALRARLVSMNKYKYMICGIILFVILLIAIIVIAISGPRHPTVAPIINGRYVKAVTSCGHVEGVLEEGAMVFRGIPYARPPVEDRRWKKPEPFTLGTCWQGTLKAHNASDTCWQVYGDGTINGNENCLTLDIITPQVRYINPLPVVVLIGAESLAGGSPGSLDLPSPRLSRIREVIFVRPNFRMGVMGYLAADELSNSTYPFTSGNYGLLDVVEALRWIQMNIVHFAGDPKAVTVMGHRAGATMLTTLLAMHKVEDLFSQAWLSSGSTVFPNKSLMESEFESKDQFLRKLNCKEKDEDCLRRLDVEELIDNVPDNWMRVDRDLPKVGEVDSPKHHWLVQDGVIIKEDLSQVWRRGNLTVKVVMGTTAHADASKLMYLEKPEWNEESIKAKVATSQLGLNLTSEIFQRYNATWTSLAAMISDIRTICPLLHLAKQIPSTSFYVATEPRGEPRLADVSTDVDAILEHYIPRSPEQRRFMTAMQQIFYRYVSLGKFDNPPSDASNNKILLIGQDPHPHADYPNCDFWITNNIVPQYARVD